MTLETFIESTAVDPVPPEHLSEELQALWFAKNDKWHESHDIAQEIHTSMGSWIHGLLHAIEGDFGNAGYWFSKAGKTAISADQIDAEWTRIAEVALNA